MLLPLSCAAQPKERKFGSWFGKSRYEETTSKEYALDRSGTITITNPYGSISVQAMPGKASVSLAATKRGASTSSFSRIQITDKRLANDTLALTVVGKPQAELPSVDLMLIVPPNVQLKLATTDGTITAAHIHGAIWATTTKGNITLTHTQGMIVAEAQEQADITINQSSGNIKATTQKGSLYLYDTTNSVVAATEKGSIQLSCKKIPSTSKIQVRSNKGALYVTLPDDVNADLIAQTKRGLVTCEHPVTTKPFTSVWDKNAWRRMRKEIYGTLGTGEASITLQNQNGNIQITKQA